MGNNLLLFQKYIPGKPNRYAGCVLFLFCGKEKCVSFCATPVHVSNTQRTTFLSDLLDETAIVSVNDMRIFLSTILKTTAFLWMNAYMLKNNSTLWTPNCSHGSTGSEKFSCGFHAFLFWSKPIRLNFLPGLLGLVGLDPSKFPGLNFAGSPGSVNT